MQRLTEISQINTQQHTFQNKKINKTDIYTKRPLLNLSKNGDMFPGLCAWQKHKAKSHWLALASVVSMPPRQCDTMSSTGRSRQKQNGGTAANRACVGVKLCCSFEISPRLTHSERQREREREREAFVNQSTFYSDIRHCCLPALFTVRVTYNTFSSQTFNCCYYYYTTIILDFKWQHKHLYETVWKWLLLKEVSSPFQSMRAVLRSSVLGTSIWSAPSKWQIKPQKPILFTDFLTAVVAPLYSCYVILSSLQKKMKCKDKGEIPGDRGVLGLGCGFARLNAVSFTGWALMAV